MFFNRRYLIHSGILPDQLASTGFRENLADNPLVHVRDAPGNRTINADGNFRREQRETAVG